MRAYSASYSSSFWLRTGTCCLLLLSRLKAAMSGVQSVAKVGNQSSGLAWFVHITDLHISQFSAEDRTRQLLQLGQLATMNHCPRNVSAHNPIITYTNSMDLYLLIPLYGGLAPAQRLHTEQVCCRAQCPLPELRQYGSCYVKP